MTSYLPSSVRARLRRQLFMPGAGEFAADLVRRIENRKIFNAWKQEGFDYALNPATGELHRVHGSSIEGSHNLLGADLASFFAGYDVGPVKISSLRNGDLIDLFDLSNGKFRGQVALDRCAHCFPDFRTLWARLGKLDSN